jgi:hypothetical protein
VKSNADITNNLVLKLQSEIISKGLTYIFFNDTISKLIPNYLGTATALSSSINRLESKLKKLRGDKNRNF